ncbi:asparaginase [Chitiniphilus shinanonensis]|uniref:asparaginase n=1 Tax=Chitiniphilus shinanonensis TaxID=553088 RepID=UPI0030581A77
MRILIIYTGGTIGMAQGPRGLAPLVGGLAAPLAQRCPGAELLEYAPLLDSSSMTPRHWAQIARDIQARVADFDGFLVLHGTDTLAWTAAALAYQLQGAGRPVVVTGAMRPWSAPDSDAPGNVEAAWALLHQPAFREVGVVFANRVYRATRVRKLDCSADEAFDSPNAPALGEYVGRQWRLDSLRLAQVPAVMDRLQPINPDWQVLSVRLAPGFNARWFGEQLRQAPPQALLVEAYGSGNLPEESVLLDTLGALATRIPVAVCTQCLRGTVQLGQYAAGSPLAAAGVFDAADMTPEASLAKLYWVMSQTPDLAVRRALFETPLLDDRSA